MSLSQFQYCLLCLNYGFHLYFRITSDKGISKNNIEQISKGTYNRILYN